MSKQSLLADFHQANGAIFSEENGWLLPSRFGDPLQEYHAVRNQVGLVDLSHQSLLRFTGPDRLSYLQGMVSNDVKQLADGDGIQAAVLDIQGKILADIRVFCARDSFLLTLSEHLKEKILSHLQRYLIADDVEINDLTAQYGALSLQGPKAVRRLRELLRQDEIPLKEHCHRPFRLNDTEGMIVRSSHTGEEGYDLLLSLNELRTVVSRIQEKGKKFPIAWIGTQAQDILRIEAGIPRYGIDMSEENILLETGLDNAVSFHKGCYLGQEVIERIRSRGHVNKKLAGMILAGDNAAGPGDMIHAGEKEIGRITSSVLSPARKCPLAMGYIHRDYLQPQTRITIEHAGRKVSAEITALPFYKPAVPLESAQELG